MKTLYGVYRAVCLGVDLESLVVRCQVPQVFADEAVTCFDVTGGMPSEGAIGWVAFESGYPDRPVWMSGTSGGAGAAGGSTFLTRDYRWSTDRTATDPGHGKVKINTVSPPLAAQVYISLYDQADTLFVLLSALVPGDLLGIYLSSDSGARIEYALNGTLVNNGGQWASIPVAVVNNYGLDPVFNNTNVRVTVQPRAAGGGGGGAGAEVWIGPTDPILLNPTTELWFDTDG